MSSANTFGALLLSLTTAALLHAECDRTPLLIRNVALWTGDNLASPRDVLFHDGRVSRIGRINQPPPAARVIDGSGDTLLPGLLDLHLHFVIPGLPKTTPDYEISGRQLLRYGVTAGRLHLASLDQAVSFRRMGLDDCSAMPRLQAGGPAIGGGAPNVDNPVFGGVKTPEEARAKVERLATAGLQWLPIHNIDKFSEPERASLFHSAAQHRLRIFTAALNPNELRQALRWPVHTVDYIDRTESPTYPPELLRLLRNRRRSLAAVPTIGIFAWYAALKSGTASLTEPYLYEFLTPANAALVQSRALQDLAGDPYVAASAKFLPTLPRKLLELIATGVPVALGTDVGSPALLHPGALWREMETWRAYGVPPQTVLRAATSLPAAILGEPDLGRLHVGARADFVLYHGSILNGAFQADRVRAVGKGGVLFVNDGNWVGPPVPPAPQR